MHVLSFQVETADFRVQNHTPSQSFIISVWVHCCEM